MHKSVDLGYEVDSRTVTNNVFLNSATVQDVGHQPGCTGKTVSFNLYDVNPGGDWLGTNDVIGTPTFVGGYAPSSHDGYAVAGGSIGYQAASDGSSMGVLPIAGPPHCWYHRRGRP